MFFILGKRTARIKRFKDQPEYCPNCGLYSFDVRVYRNYYHLFFIPIFAYGIKTVKARCNNCGTLKGLGIIEQEYEKKSRSPFYLYAVLLLIAALVISIAIVRNKTQKEKAIFVANPKVGDVYLIQQRINDTTSYFFLRLSQIKADTIFAYHTNYVYNRFVAQLDEADYFDSTEELIFLHAELKAKLKNGEIASIDRDYGSYEGFDRIK